MPTPQEIAAFVAANQNNPQAILAAANANGVSLDQIAQATGYSGQQIGSYLGNNGLTASDFTAGSAAPASAPAAAPAASGGLTPQQIAEARQWATAQGLASWGPNGQASITGGENNNAAYNLAGAAQAKGYGADALAQILGGNYTGAGVSQWLGQHQPNVDVGASVFNADQSRAAANPMGTPIHGMGTGMPMGAGPMPAQPGQAGQAGMSSGYGMPQSSGGVGANPYLSGYADDITRRLNQQQGLDLQSSRAGSIMNGGLGGDRQGVAEGLIRSGTSDALGSALNQLYGQDWSNQQNRNIQWAGLDNQRYGMDQNFYTQQRGQDQSGAALGATLTGLGMQNDWAPLNNASGIYGQYTGLNSTTTQGSNTGGGWQGALGGALGAGQFARNAGWW